MVNHDDLARAAFDQIALPAPPRTVQDALRYLNRLLSMLPSGEHAGYVTAPPGGENSAYLPTGEFVRVGRVCYPDGQLYKVMADVPNGGPQWTDNGLVPAGQKYVSYSGDHTVPTDPGTPTFPDMGGYLDLIDGLAQRIAQLETARVHEIGTLNEQLKNLTERVAALPASTVSPTHTHQIRVFGLTVNTGPPR